jgi:hypothetical protein
VRNTQSPHDSSSRRRNYAPGRLKRREVRASDCAVLFHRINYGLSFVGLLPTGGERLVDDRECERDVAVAGLEFQECVDGAFAASQDAFDCS